MPHYQKKRIIDQILWNLQFLQARYCLQCNIHIVAIIIAYILSAIHSCHAILFPNNPFVTVIKWFDPTIGQDNTVLIIFFFIMILIVITMILWQIYAVIKWKSMEFNIIQKYLIKVIGTIGFILTHAFLLPILRATIKTIYKMNHQQSENMVNLSWITLISFTCIILPFHGLFLLDLAPLSKNAYCNLSYFNYMRMMPIIRLFFSLNYVIFQTCSTLFLSLSLTISLVLMLKQPVENYKYNGIIRIINYCGIWPMVLRIMSVLQGYLMSLSANLICWPFFISFLILLSSKIVKGIINQENQEIKKLKILLSRIQSEDYTEMSYYFLKHCQSCVLVQCNCKFLKLSSQQGKDHNQKLWYQLLSRVIQKQYPLTSISLEVQSKKRQMLPKFIEIYSVYTNLISVSLKKWNSALYHLLYFKSEIRKQQFISFSFQAYYFKFIELMQQFNRFKIAQPDIISRYAQNYYQFQKYYGILQRNIKKSAEIQLNLWKQLQKPDPNVQSIVYLLKSQYKYRQVIQSSINIIENKFENSKEIISHLTSRYYFEVCQQKNTIIKNLPPLIEKNQYKHNLMHFNLREKTKLFVVSLQNDQSFGKITMANSSFITFIGLDDIKELSINKLFVQEDQEEQKMRNFAQGDEFITNRIAALFIQSDCFKMCNLQIHIIPSVVRTIEAACFIISQTDEMLFFCNQEAQIICQSSQLLKAMKQYKLKDIFTEQIFNQVIKNKTYRMKNIFNLSANTNTFELQLIKVSNKKSNSSKQYLIKVNIIQNLKTIVNLQEKSDQKTEQKFYQQTEQKPHQQLNGKFHQKKEQKAQQKMSNFQKDNKDQNLKKNLKEARSSRKDDQQKVNEKLALDKILNQVNNLGQSSKIFVWKVSIIIFIFGLLILAFIIISMGFTIKQSLWKKYSRNIQTHKLKDRIVQSQYYLRRAHIEALTTKNQYTFSYCVNRFNSSNEDVIRIVNNISLDYSLKTYGCSLQKNEVNYKMMSIYEALNLNILLSTTTLASATIQDFRLPLMKNQQKSVLGNYQKKFLEAKVNGLFFVIPFLDKIFYHDQCYSDCSEEYNIKICLLVGFLFIIIIFTISLYIFFKIISLKNKTNGLLSYISSKQIATRSKSIQSFLSHQFAKQSGQQDNKSNKLTKTNRRQNGLSILSKLKSLNRQETKYQSNHNIQQSNRQICLSFQQQNIIVPNQITKLNQNKSPIIFGKFTFYKIFTILISIVIPILMSFIALTSYDLQNLKNLRFQFANRALIQKRKNILNQINLYTIELGFDENQHFDENITVSSILIERLQLMYSLERQFKRYLNQGKFDSNIINKYKMLNEKNICEFIETLTTVPNLEVKFEKQECKNIGGRQDLTRGMWQGVVGYIEQSRSLWMNYRNCTNCTIQRRMQFISSLSNNQSSILQILNIFLQYFSVILDEQENILREHFLQRLIQFSKVTLIIGIFCLFSCFLTLYLLLIFLHRKIRKQCINIRSIFRLISQDTIRQDKILKNKIIHQINYQFFK